MSFNKKRRFLNRGNFIYRHSMHFCPRLLSIYITVGKLKFMICQKLKSFSIKHFSKQATNKSFNEQRDINRIANSC